MRGTLTSLDRIAQQMSKVASTNSKKICAGPYPMLVYWPAQSNSVEIKFPYVPKSTEGTSNIISSGSAANTSPSSLTWLTLARKREEPISFTIQRIHLRLKGLESKQNKKRQKKMKNKPKQEEEEDCNEEEKSMSLHFLTDENVPMNLEKDPSLSEVLAVAKQMILEDEVTYNIHINKPQLKSVALPKSGMVGAPLLAKVQGDCLDSANLSFEWSYCQMEGSDEAHSPPWNCKRWQRVSAPIARGPMFLPQEEHHNCWVAVQVQVADGESPAVSAMMQSPLRPAPVQAALAHRWKQLPPGPSQFPQFRVLTYNLLADTYADSDYSRQVLFPYCPPQFLTAAYRQQLTLRELLNYEADLMALQEMDADAFSKVYQSALGAFGWQGYLLNKGSAMGSEGVALFMRQSRFQLIEDASLDNLSRYLSTSETTRDVYQRVSVNPQVVERLATRSQVALVHVVRDLAAPEGGPCHLCICTTHLYFSPDANHIRVLHTYAILKHLETVLARYPHCGLIFLGDFNASRRYGSVKLITSGKLGADAIDWVDCTTDEIFGGVDLQHSLGCLHSSYPEEEASGVKTNFTAVFKEDLDHMFYRDAELQLESSLPLPNMEQMQEFGAIPNEHFPSDHLALCSTFSWTSQRISK